jgi:hypothetical protein
MSNQVQKFLSFIPSPLDSPVAPTIGNTEHLPIITRRGRVIYDRRTHFWSERDVQRVMANYFQIQMPKDPKLPFWMILMENATMWMMNKIMSLLTGGKSDEQFISRLYYLLRNSLARIIDRLLKSEKDDLEGLSGGAH